MIILGILAFGMGIGWLAQLLLGGESGRTDWVLALVAGLGGSLLGGVVANLISGDGLKLHASGVIGTLSGAIAITAVWQYFERKRLAEQRDAARAARRSGHHH